MTAAGAPQTEQQTITARYNRAARIQDPYNQMLARSGC